MQQSRLYADCWLTFLLRLHSRQDVSCTLWTPASCKQHLFHTNIYHCGHSFACHSIAEDYRVWLFAGINRASFMATEVLHKNCTIFLLLNTSLCQTVICNTQMLQLWPKLEKKKCTRRQNYSDANLISLLGHID